MYKRFIWMIFLDSCIKFVYKFLENFFFLFKFFLLDKWFLFFNSLFLLIYINFLNYF